MSKDISSFILSKNSEIVFAKVKGPHAKTYHIFKVGYIKALCSELTIDDKTLTRKVKLNELCQKCQAEHIREIYGDD
jgi:hypothetical protein